MDKREILTALDNGELEVIIQKTYAASELNDIHNALFHKALELGTPRPELGRRIDEASYDVARRSLLDYRSIKQMSRKTIEDYDPQLAIELYKSQIGVMMAVIKDSISRRASGIERPEMELFNSQAYGQALSTASLDGTPTVAVFTSLAFLETDRLVFGRIGHEKAYQNLKQNPRCVFTAVGPSNDPTKYDFVTISAELTEDVTTGEKLDSLRQRLGPAVTNCMIFKVVETRVLHLPKPVAAAR